MPIPTLRGVGLKSRKSLDELPVTKVEVLIVGAGSTGLFLANEMVSFNISFRIIDSSRSTPLFAKGMGLSAQTMEILNNRNMLESFLQKGRPLNSYTVRHKGTKVASLPVLGSDTPFPFSLLLSEIEVAKCLEQELVKKTGKSLVVEYSTTLLNYNENNNGVRAFLRHDKNGLEIIECQYIIGCDDIDSAVRTGSGHDWDFEAYSSIGLWVLGDVTMSSSDISDEEVTLFLHKEGLLTFHPFQSHNQRFRVAANLQDVNFKKLMLSDQHIPIGKTLSTSAEKSVNLEINGLTFTELQDVIKERATGTSVNVEAATWTSYFSPIEGKAKGFRRGRAFLCGDAAHSHSPAIGFGHDSGIQDAHNLAWKLFLVLTKRSSNPDVILDSYSAEREPTASAAIQKATYVTTLLAKQGNIVDLLRTYLVSKIPQVPFLSQLINTDVLQTRSYYSQSPIIKYSGEYSDSMAGYLETSIWPISYTPRIFPGYHLPDTILRSLKIQPGKDAFTLYSKIAENISFILLLLTSTHSILPRNNPFFFGYQEVIERFSDVLRPMVIALPSAVEYTEAEEFAITCRNFEVGVEPSGKLHSYAGCQPGDMVVILVRPDFYIASISKVDTRVDILADLMDFLREYFLDFQGMSNSKTK